MYTSGTTGDPKGVLISNESIITLLAGVKRLLESVNEEVTSSSSQFIDIFRKHNWSFSFILGCWPFAKLPCFSVSFMKLDANDVYLSFLPLAHIFDRVIEELFIWTGASIGFWRGVSAIVQLLVAVLLPTYFSSDNFLFVILQDVKLLTEDIAELKPTIFCAVPRVLDRIYAGTIRI